MSTKLEELKTAARVQAKAARDIAEKVQAENRAWTDGEKSDYDAAMAKGRELVDKINVARADEKILTDAKALADEIGPEAKDAVDAAGKSQDVRQRVKSLGLQVVDSPEFKKLMNSYPDGRIPEKSRVQSDPIKVKGLLTGASDTSGGAFVVNEQTGIIEPLGRRPLTLRDLVSVRRTGSDAVEYVRQTAHTNAAAPVAEATSSAAPTAPGSAGALILNPGGGYKPEGSWAYVRDTAVVKTIAEWVPATKRALSDVAALEGLINDELRADIAETEEDQMLNGDGTGENLPGILRSGSGIQSQAFVTDIFTSVRKGITKAQVVGRVNPTAVMLSPGDAETVDLARENGTTGAFIGAGPFAAGQRTLWGYPTVVSEALSTGTALVADFRKAVLWDREQTTVSVSDSHADFFIRNLVAILAEERVAFANTRPTAFVKVATA